MLVTVAVYNVLESKKTLRFAVIMVIRLNHRLRGSASPVLTATGFV